MAVDSQGDIFVAGQVPPVGVGSVSNPILPIPATSTPFQAAPKGINIGILKLNSTATSILAATYLGGSSTEQVGGLAVDTAGNLYVVGNTTSNDFPTTQGVLQTSFGSSGQNVFVAKLNSSLSALAYSTYLGQNSAATVGFAPITNVPTPLPYGRRALAIDAAGNVYIAGEAISGFPTTAGAFSTACGATLDSGNFCAFVSKLNSDASSLLYSTYLSGVFAQAHAVGVDSSQNIYVGGQTAAGYPEVNPLQSCANGGAFVSEINLSGALAFSTCLAGASDISDLVLDPSGRVYIVGPSANGLLLKNPIQSNPTEAFVASINPSSNPPLVLFSSFVGGSQSNEGGVVTSTGVDSAGNIYAVGYANFDSQLPPSFPVYNALYPTVPPCTDSTTVNCTGEGSYAFVMKISPTDAPAAAFTPALLSFPPQQVGTSSTAEPVTVIDLGSASLTVSDATVSGDFSIQNNCSTVSSAGGTCTIQVTFTPTLTGTRTGTLSITDNSAGSPRTVELTGQGAVTTVAVAPGSLTFASQPVGTTSSAQTIAVTNPGPLGLQIGHLQASGDFSETNNCGTSLSPTGSCTVNVTFTPTATGSRTGTLTITDNAPDSPQTVALSGTGGNPSLGLSIASGGSSSAKVTAGSSATYSLSIGGGGMSGTASLSCTGAPAEATCSVPATESVSASTASNFTLSVTTTAPGHVAVRPRSFGNTPWVWAFALFGFIILPRVTPRCGALRVVYLVPLFVVMLCSCGGGSSNTAQNPGTPAGTYTLTVTANSGNTTQTQNLTLVVQ